MMATDPLYRSLSKSSFIEIYESDAVLIGSGGVGRSPNGETEGNAVKLTADEVVALYRWLDEYMKGRKTESIVIRKLNSSPDETPPSLLSPVPSPHVSAEVKEIVASLKLSHDRSRKLLEDLADWAGSL